ncbi:MAG: hypothetical protein LBP59_18475 [Planctomycetaceae bacterium]|nr:hypothetical protein [Planctomycetaceae bacterium]
MQLSDSKLFTLDFAFTAARLTIGRQTLRFIPLVLEIQRLKFSDLKASKPTVRKLGRRM